MNTKDYIFEIFPKIINYRMTRLGLAKPANPITLTFSVTAACNSLCKTCNIGEKSRKNPQRTDMDLTLEEIEKAFKSLGHVYFFNISGGEPFQRKDLPEIVELACKHLTPKIIHTPTNALIPNRIHENSLKILDIIKKYDPEIHFSVKPSIDGVGEKHDEIRGVPGNFKKLEETIKLLKEIEKQHPNFYLELGTVVSKFNLDQLDRIEDYVHSVGVQSYRNEIAEQREEFFNLQDPITPTAEEYEQLMSRFKEKIKKNIRGKKKLTRTTEALRLVYYDLVSEILKGNNIPCYAGISNAHMNFDGQLWPCCVIGYAHPLGSLRDNNYDFQKVWHSKEAIAVRKYIKDNKCSCPLANQAYSNILCNFKSMLKAIKTMLYFK